MSLAIRRYRRKPEPLEAVLVTALNVEEAISWAGGKPPVMDFDGVEVPVLGRNWNSMLGKYLTKDENGSFHVKEPAYMNLYYEECPNAL